MTRHTAQSIRDAVSQLEAGTLPVATIAINLRAYAEAVDRIERDLTSLRSAASAVALAIGNLGENSRIMLHAIDQKQPRATDGGVGC